jgi:putative lipoprotein
MRKPPALFALLVVALLALPAAAAAQATSRVTGTAVIRQRVALPNNAVVTFQLLDASRAGTAAVVLAEQKFTTNGRQAPFQFELQYDPARIQQSGVYVVQGNVVVDGRLRYATTQQYRVITGGGPSTITIELQAIAPLPSTAGGDMLLAIVALLLAIVLGLRYLRPRLFPSSA